ncbi:MAG: EamA family transporter RarD [Anaerolineales bacterium]|nr:EamA family transporter RarD [Anaerolineales bacterium]
MKKSIGYGVFAYALWGLFPLYWKLLQDVPALQIIGHRVFWSLALLIVILLATKQWKNFRSVAFNKKTLGIYAVASFFLTVNWLIYVWGVNADFVIETSLGYFINPLLSVLFGVFFLRERLRPAQWIPVVLATFGVVWLTVEYGRLPWIALALAVSFGLYGLLKKISPLGSLYGLTLETGIALPFALAYLLFVNMSGSGAFLHRGAATDLLLMGAGAVTTIPLLLFASAAREIPLNMVGILQYLTPTLQFLIGVFVYKETFDHAQLVGFGAVWLALIVFWGENLLAHRTPPPTVPELGD